MNYASLIGPLVGLYFPLPSPPPDLNLSGTDEMQYQRLMLNASRLRSLWCSVYTDEETDQSIAEFGGHKIAAKNGRHLDYDDFEIRQQWKEFSQRKVTA